jgi:hypothetical protein
MAVPSLSVLGVYSIPDTVWFWALGFGFFFLETQKAIRMIKSGRLRSLDSKMQSEVDSVFSAAEKALDAQEESAAPMQRRLSTRLHLHDHGD